MHLEIVSPEATLFTGEVTSVTVPGVDGEFQMLNNHAAIISLLQKGFVKIESSSEPKGLDQRFSKDEKGKLVLPIKSGTVEMKDNTIIVLVD